MTGPAIATFNTGSSSIKFSLWRLAPSGKVGACQVRGAISDLGGSPEFRAEGLSAAAAAEAESLPLDTGEPAGLIGQIAGLLETTADDGAIAAAGHRVVHGGRRHDGPVIATPDILQALDDLSVFAPAHQPHNLAGVNAVEARWPDVPQTLSFDTAFHRTVPDVAQSYALPRGLTDEGLIRYGFHGLSYAHMAAEAPRLFDGRAHDRIVGLHLGSGASACAIRGGRSVATSMGLTALDGLMMATRCGDIDPGLVLYLIEQRGMSAADVSDILYGQSGLLGVSGISSDMRMLAESKARQAEEAIALYAYRAARETASLMGALEGLDAIIFSGGVGEHAASVRDRICRHLAWTGLDLDAAANARHDALVSAPGSDIAVAILPADEERIIAEEAAACLAAR